MTADLCGPYVSDWAPQMKMQYLADSLRDLDALSDRRHRKAGEP